MQIYCGIATNDSTYKMQKFILLLIHEIKDADFESLLVRDKWGTAL